MIISAMYFRLILFPLPLDFCPFRIDCSKKEDRGLQNYFSVWLVITTMETGNLIRLNHSKGMWKRKRPLQEIAFGLCKNLERQPPFIVQNIEHDRNFSFFIITNTLLLCIYRKD